MQKFDAVVIGSGLGGLTAGAQLAKAGYAVLLLERNFSLGGAASVYRVGSLTIEQASQDVVVKQHVAAGADRARSEKRGGCAREEEHACRKERSMVVRVRPSIFLARLDLDGLR